VKDSRRRSWLVYAWTAPTTALAGPGLALARLSGGRLRVREGLVEAWGGGLAWILRVWPLMPGGVAALALGHVLLATDERTLELVRPHELVHVRQAERLGPLFVPAYLAASVWAVLRGRHPYYDNAFEREAYAEAPILAARLGRAASPEEVAPAQKSTRNPI
jgi:hypothetical protein